MTRRLPCCALIEQRPQMLVVGLEDLTAARLDFLGAERRIARNPRRLRNGGNRGRDPRTAIAVDDEPRVVLRHERRIERGRDSLSDPQSTDVPRDMPLEIKSRKSEGTETLRDAPARMIDHDHERRAPAAPELEDRSRLIRREQSIAQYDSSGMRAPWPGSHIIGKRIGPPHPAARIDWLNPYGGSSEATPSEVVPGGAR